jgi:2-polyprenyl-3-methyl-5-hydroxy-6-metoxy-1,4-benzoquinol methylase
MKPIKKCEICGNTEFKFLFNGNDKLLGVEGKFSLNECKKCKAIFLNPQPSFKELEKHYSNKEYYSLKKINTRKSVKTRIKLRLYDVYFNPQNKNFLKKALYSPLKFFVRGTSIIPKKKLLDIGSGSGQFLYEMKSLGLDVYGVEPGDFDKEGSKNYKLNIKNMNLLKAKYPKESFDLITINHVLEHLDNPNQSLKEIHRIIKKSGLLIIGIPNTNSFARRIFNRNWLAFDVPRHLWDYSDKNVKTLLEKNRFKIRKIRYNSRPNQFVISIFFALGIKRRDGLLNKLLDILFLPLTWAVNTLKTGDQIEIWCSPF